MKGSLHLLHLLQCIIDFFSKKSQNYLRIQKKSSNFARFLGLAPNKQSGKLPKVNYNNIINSPNWAVDFR